MQLEAVLGQAAPTPPSRAGALMAPWFTLGLPLSCGSSCRDPAAD